MNLLDILDKSCIKAPLEATDKKGVIEELVQTLVEAHKVDEEVAQELCQVVWEREQARTTGIGHGLAIPHGKSVKLHELLMAIGKPAQPIDFASIDNKPVRLVVLLVSPVDRTSDHIQALASVSRLMTNEAFREALYAAPDADSIYRLLEEAQRRPVHSASNGRS
ncbi:MAG: PTS sugar transporter subunit IIA [Planctomycetota bacterium]|nr:MAG: PTS sugar transporter subunit IIA [Planctomycetota bacterium]